MTSVKTRQNRFSRHPPPGVGRGPDTATPFDTPRLMTELVTWFKDERATARLHPLLLIGICMVVFLEIHPFQDGNGRLSRVLTTLLLLQAGYAYVPYSSLESVIEQSKEGSPRPAADARNNPNRITQLAALAGLLPACAGRASTTPESQGRARKNCAGRIARTITTDRRIRQGTWTRDDGRCDATDRRQSQYAQAAFPRLGQSRATETARGWPGGVV